MRAVGFGINPSSREPEYEHFNSPSQPDPTVRATFLEIFGEDNFRFSDVLKERESDSKKILNSLDLELKLQKNKPRIISLIQEFEPDILVLMFKNSKLTSFMQSILKELDNPPKVVNVWQPYYAFGYGKIKRWNSQDYAEHIRSEMKKQLDG